jgi:hypothetical protein
VTFKDFNDLVKIAKDNNFIVTSTNRGKHNVGSKHYMNLAIDVRTRDKTAKQIADFMQLLRREGLIVRDERTRPRGQKVWGGAHLHIEISGNRPSAINRDTVLKKGSKGEAVLTLQNRLAKLGFLKPKDIDGDFGDITEKAVIAFQTHYGINVDGEVGDETKKKLTEALASQSLVTAETNPTEQEYKVSDEAAQGLYIRTAPIVTDSTKIAALPMGQKVTKLTESSTPNWWQVSTDLDGTELIGYVNSAFLIASKSFVAPKAVKGVSRIDLQRSGDVTRKNKAWAYALNETGRPTRNATSSAANKVKALTDIVKWLDVENTGHLRYKPVHKGPTYCNIYAYDYCYLAGVYLPRVWWDAKSLINLNSGKSVTPVLGKTVFEQNANSLFKWLKDFGSAFGWRRTVSLDDLQNAANNGQVVIISAINKIPNESGHIVAVVPETSSNKAERKDGLVVKPLQSQAGRDNHIYQTDPWWIKRAAAFREHGFWINAS